MRTRYAGAQNKKCGGKGLSMSNQLKENGATMLERWKALVKIENRIARRNWGAPSGTFVKPAALVNSEEQAAREQRDAQIEAWVDAGICTRDISTRTGLADTTIDRILSVHRMEARTAYNPPADQANNRRVAFTRFRRPISGENLCP